MADDKNMKVLFLTNHLRGDDGLSKVSLDFAEELQNLGHDVLCLTHEKSHQTKIKEVLVLDNLLKYLANPLVAFLTAIRIRKIVQNFSPDIIHFMEGSYANILPFLKIGKAKTCITVHGTYSVIPILFKSFFKKTISSYLSKSYYQKVDGIAAVSNYTKSMIIEKYGISPYKINVVHNAVDFEDKPNIEEFGIKKKDKVVLFMGRLTLQKGPDYFVHAAKKVLEHEKNVKFVICGNGDMEPSIVNKVAEMGLAGNVLFAGFLQGQDVERAYKMADVYVMPSVSEPFGITPLEAMSNGVPTIISRTSGVSEVIRHCLLVDFWDIDDISSKIISVLRYSQLTESLKENAFSEIRHFNWNIPAQKCIDIYNRVAMNN